MGLRRDPKPDSADYTEFAAGLMNFDEEPPTINVVDNAPDINR